MRKGEWLFPILLVLLSLNVHVLPKVFRNGLFGPPFLSAVIASTQPSQLGPPLVIISLSPPGYSAEIPNLKTLSRPLHSLLTFISLRRSFRLYVFLHFVFLFRQRRCAPTSGVVIWGTQDDGRVFCDHRMSLFSVFFHFFFRLLGV